MIANRYIIIAVSTVVWVLASPQAANPQGSVFDFLGAPVDLRKQREMLDYREQLRLREEERQQARHRAQAEIIQRVLEIRAANPDTPAHQLIVTVLQDPVLKRNTTVVPIEQQLRLAQDLLAATSSSAR
jgi:hypothetical protein